MTKKEAVSKLYEEVLDKDIMHEEEWVSRCPPSATIELLLVQLIREVRKLQEEK